MQTEQGEIFEGKVTGITNFGAFVSLPDGKSGMVHISEVSDGFVRDIGEFLKVGDTVRVSVVNVDERGRISLSIKRAAKLQAEKPAAQSTPGISARPDKRSERDSGTDAGQNERKPFEPPSEYVPMGRRKAPGYDSFEDMMTKFKADSNERFSDIKRSADSKRSGGYPKPSRKKN